MEMDSRHADKAVLLEGDRLGLLVECGKGTDGRAAAGRGAAGTGEEGKGVTELRLGGCCCALNNEVGRMQCSSASPSSCGRSINVARRSTVRHTPIPPPLPPLAACCLLFVLVAALVAAVGMNCCTRI
jgi:hypothetical protein